MYKRSTEYSSELKVNKHLFYVCKNEYTSRTLNKQTMKWCNIVWNSKIPDIIQNKPWVTIIYTGSKQTPALIRYSIEYIPN